MARIDKCDVCRLRKIKCDLRRPICSQCKIKGRPCSYNGERRPGCNKDNVKLFSRLGTPDEDGLRLVGQHKAITGASYHTLALTKAHDEVFRVSNSLPRPLNDDSGMLLSRLSRLAQETIGDPRFHISGTLLEQATNRIGSHPALDAAISYFVDSYSAFKTSDQSQINTARRGGVNAVASLRDALSTQLDRHEEAVMVSMSIHIEAEYFREHFANTLIHLHSKGLFEMLKTRRQHGRSGYFDMIVLRTMCIQEFSRAVFSGGPSILDDGGSPSSSYVETVRASFDVDQVSNDVMIQLLRLPRLASLARRGESQPENLALGQATFALAKALYVFQIEPLPIHIMTSSTTECDANLDLEDLPIDSWLSFHSMLDYNLAVHYYTFRVIICAIMQRLLRQFDLASYEGINLDSVVLEEVQAAESIVRCSQYALSHGSNPAWMALRLSLPNQAAYGTWNRLHHGCTVNDCCDVVVDVEKASRMKQFCVQFTARIQGIENEDTTELEPHLANFSEMVIGGALVIDMEAKVKSMNWRFRQFSDGKGF